jgi:carbonic anhydrase
LTEENVLLQLQHLRTHPGVAAGLATGKVRLHGWIYSIGEGRVDAFDEATRQFRPIEEVVADSDKPLGNSQHPTELTSALPSKAG